MLLSNDKVCCQSKDKEISLKQLPVALLFFKKTDEKKRAAILPARTGINRTFARQTNI